LKDVTVKVVAALVLILVMPAGPAKAQPARPLGATAPPRPSVERWKVVVEKNPMNDQRVVTALLKATLPIKGWLATATPTLVVRCQKGLAEKEFPPSVPIQPGLEVYIVTEMPATVENSEGIHNVRVRFDDHPATVWGTSESTDKKALFIAPIYATRMIVTEQMLANSRRMLVEFTPFNASPVVATFDVRGFSVHAKEVLSACPESDRTAWRYPPGLAPATDQNAGNLIGLAVADLAKRIGQAKSAAGYRLTYETDEGDLLLYLDDGKVSRATPGDVPLRLIHKREDAPVSEPPAPRQPVPGGAIARCVDGGFVFVDTGTETCQGHGGIDERIDPRLQPTRSAPATAPPIDSAQQTDLHDATKRPANELLGMAKAEVMRILGDPSLIANGTWSYDTSNGSLQVVIKDEKVAEIRPQNFDLALIITKSVAEAPSAATPARALPKRPTEAVAQCGDGLFVFVSTGPKTCGGHGGVKDWFVKP
jgi:hypothetical protein